MNTARMPDFIEWMPMAANVPRTVATSVASAATETVTYSACRIERSCSSSPYHFSEKPPQTARVSLALNE